MDHDDITIGQLYEIEGEIYEIHLMRITCIESNTVFVATASFKSHDPNSENPRFEERIENVIDNPIFNRIQKEPKVNL